MKTIALSILALMVVAVFVAGCSSNTNQLSKDQQSVNPVAPASGNAAPQQPTANSSGGDAQTGLDDLNTTTPDLATVDDLNVSDESP